MSASVAIEIRAIAAGPAADGHVRLTLSVMPVVPVQNDTRPTVSMADWPRWTEIVEKAFKHRGQDNKWLRLVAAKTSRTGAKRPELPTDEPPSIELRYDQSPLKLEDVRKYWAELAGEALMGREDAPAGYAEAARKTFKETQLDGFWTDVAAVFKDGGDARYTRTVNGAVLPDVLGTGRSDAAIHHLMSRAERLVQRVASRGTALPQGLDGVVEGAKETKPWTDDQLQLGGLETQFEGELKKALDEERNVVSGAATSYLDQNRSYLTLVWNAINAAAGSAMPDYSRSDAPPTLAGSAMVQLLHRNPDALKRAQNLHLASLLPDATVAGNSYRPKGALSAGKAGELERDDPAAPVAEPADFVARTFVAAIRSSPMLARLFRFVIDVDVKLDDLNLEPLRPDDQSEDSYAFTLLAAGMVNAANKLDYSSLSYTIAKATFAQQERAAIGSKLPVKKGQLTGFWPATREELDLRFQPDPERKPRSMAEIRRTGAVSQVDGVVDLAQAAEQTDVDSHNPRFDIITIDPVLAMEASFRNARRKASHEESRKRLNLPEETVTPLNDDEPETGLVTRGLAIVDRRRAEYVAKEIMTANPATRSRLLDADDLTIGYRIDVAVRVGDNDAEWRSLMEREIDYRRIGQEGGKVDDFRDWFKALGLDRGELTYEKARRRDYDAGIMMPTSRRRLIDGGGEVREIIHAEERLATWSGDPLGLNCHSDEVLVRPGSDVAITRNYTLPSETNEGDRKAWPLRYGWAYRFGIRPVWLGGVTLPLVEAIDRYESRVDGYRNITLPVASKVGAAEVRSWRRFLRHEPILSPVVLLPDAEAKAKSDLAPQSGIRAILRTLSVDPKPDDPKSVDPALDAVLSLYDNRQTGETWRLILPPQVPLDEAVRHGMFDADGIGAVPSGNLPAIEYGSDERQAAGRQGNAAVALGQQHAGFPAVVRADGEGDAMPNGERENVFRVRSGTANKTRKLVDQYYIDPMADCLVVAVRPNTDHPGTGYFDGERKLFQRAKAIPLALRIVADRTSQLRGGGPIRQEHFWDGKPRVQTVSGDKIEGAGAGIQAHVATLKLRAGESVDVDCWYVPSVGQLKAYFDWPETLAVKAFAEAPVPTDPLQYRQALIARLRVILEKRGMRAAASAEDLAILDRYSGQSAWCGLGGLMADPAAVAAAAEILHNHMKQYPIPEIAAIRTIDVVHAVARPPRRARFEANNFILIRSPSDEKARKEVLEKASKEIVEKKEFADLLASAPENTRFGKRGDDGILFAGTVELDRDTCRQLEIRAHCVSPARTAFDDVTRGRTELQRLLGEWPDRIVPLSAVSESETNANEFLQSQSARFLYGFDVGRGGKVYLPKQWITLLLIDDLTERAADSKFAALEQVDLVQHQLDTLSRRLNEDKKKPHTAGLLRAMPLDRYSDRLARKLTVALRVTSRFDQHFTYPAAKPVPETAFPPDPAHTELITQLSYDHKYDEQLTQFVDAPPAGVKEQIRTVWIPSTIAPAKPQVHTVLPAYQFEEDPLPAYNAEGCLKWMRRRKPRIRIVLDRPWFSSGEGERLGVVLWPPQLRTLAKDAARKKQLKAGGVPRSALHSFDENDLAREMKAPIWMQLADFEDEDLGPGGKFTTRWGADPIRANADPTGPFVPSEVFIDLPAEGASDSDIGFEPGVKIPLVDLREEDEKEQAKLGVEGANPGADAVSAEKPKTKSYDTLTAALMTYEPRFDVESEKWFVDIALNPGSVVEPFMRFGLVRYQHNALDNLGVSAPVAVWAQIPPTRTVEVFASMENGDVRVKVQVSGNAGGRLKDDRIPGDGQEPDLVFPRMRISVVESGKTSAGVTSERVAEWKKPGEKEPVPAVVWVAHGGTPFTRGSWESSLVWLADFILPPIKKSPGELELNHYSVLVEEVEEFLSTADESAAPPVPPPAPAVVAAVVQDAKTTAPDPAPPIPKLAAIDVRPVADDEVGAGHARTGPRFLMRIDLKKARNEMAEAQQDRPVIEPPLPLRPAQALRAPARSRQRRARARPAVSRAADK